MSAIDSDKKQWPDPKDFGLPFVEITPIRAKTEAVKTEAEKLPSEPGIVVETKTGKTLPSLSETKPVNEEAVKTFESIIQSLDSTPIDNKSKEEKKSSAWVWAVVLIGLGIVSVIIWQIQSRMNTTKSNPAVEVNEPSQKEVLPAAAELTPESTLTDQNQKAVNQDSINTLNNSNPNISKPAETGTTIANTGSGKLIRVESKADRPQYFIIVGSLPNEKMALEEANLYLGKSLEIYLIAPIDGGRNYRLALARFGSFTQAAEKLEEIKSQYTEELWILKY
ncbi:MAG TPA: hypothetical protein VLA71_21455 [Algoriphagus sp.]|nr:hypothetical protein [Algoriphagus sp.]